MKLKAFYLLALLVLVAMPAGASIIDPPPTDKSIEYMRYIFGGATDLLVGKDLPDKPDSILGAMSVILNIGCLLFSGIIIGYTALSGLLNSAHEGNVMGKAYSSMWVPLRTTIAIAMLLPLGSGFSAMQLGVLWFAGKGVGLADSTWNYAVDHMNTTGRLYPLNPTTRGEALASEILKRAACVDIVNRAHGESVAWGKVVRHFSGGETMVYGMRFGGAGGPVHAQDFDRKADFSNPLATKLPADACGSVMMNFTRPNTEVNIYLPTCLLI